MGGLARRCEGAAVPDYLMGEKYHILKVFWEYQPKR